MKWRGRRQSTNVEDARGKRMSGSGVPLAGLLHAVMRLLGPKGLIALVAVGIIGWQMGLIDPASLLGGGGQVTDVEFQSSAEEDALLQFVSVVLADTEDIWTAEFQRIGRQYRKPELVIYRQKYPTACGTGDARMGPFYCPADQKIYIDLSFYESLEREFSAPGDFAQAYVIAHEVGHHIQKILGNTDRVHRQRGRVSDEDFPAGREDPPGDLGLAGSVGRIAPRFDICHHPARRPGRRHRRRDDHRQTGHRRGVGHLAGHPGGPVVDLLCAGAVVVEPSTK